MSIAILVAALLPVFFVLVLGYAAGRYHRFSTDQATGFNQLATNFAMPASLFIDMVQINRQLLLQQGVLLLVLLAAHLGLFGVICLGLRGRFGLSFTAVILLALAIASSSTAVYGAAVLSPVEGKSSQGTVGLVALVINLLVPIALFLLQKSSPPKPAAAAGGPPAVTPPKPAASAGAAPPAATPPKPAAPPAAGKGSTDKGPASPGAAPASPPATSVAAALRSAATSPLLLAPLLGVALVLLAVRLPAVLLAPLQLLGHATTSVAVFAVGLTLAAHRLSFSKLVLAASLARVTAQSALLLGLLLLFHVHSELARAAVLACSLPVGVLQVLLASRYGTLEKELPSVMLITNIAMLGTLPAWFALINWLLPK